jgi:hypothetical protein
MPNLAKLSYMDDHHFTSKKKEKKLLHFSQPLPPKVFYRKKINKKKRKTKTLVSPLVAPVSIQTVEGP